MRDWIEANINDYVLVRLTPFGENLWVEKWAETARIMKLPKGEVPVAIRESCVLKDGRVRFQMWDLMATFGEVLYNGAIDHPFVGNKIWYQRKPK
jgi:hypothetical protein